MRVARLAIALGTMFALTSVGGVAIVGAPFLVPALWWASLSARPWVRAGLTFLAGLVMAEVGWFLVYATMGEEQPYIVLGPALGFIATIVAFTITTRTCPRGVAAGER